MFLQRSAPFRLFLAAVFWGSFAAAAADTGKMCRLPRPLKVNAPEALLLEDLKTVSAARAADLTAEPDPNRAFLRFILTAEGTPEHPQGYLMEIAADRISIRARTLEGLFNGMQELNDLMRRAAGDELPQGRRIGIPGFDERAVSFSLADRSASSRDIKRIRRVLRLLAALRCNRVLIDFGDNFPHPPEVSSQAAKPMDETAVKDLAAFAGERFVKIVPLLPLRRAGCPRREKDVKRLRAAVRRQCELLRPDEVVFRLDFGDLEKHRRNCPHCRGAAAEKLLAEYLALFAKCAAASRTRAGFILPDLPEKAASGVSAGVPAGTRIYGLKTGGRTPDAAIAGEPDKLLRGIADSRRRGSRAFILLDDIYLRNGDLAAPLSHTTTPMYLDGLVRGAFAMWSPEHPRLPEDPAQYFNLVHSGKTRRRNFRTAVPVAIQAQLNVELNSTGRFPRLEDPAHLEEMRRALAASPERFELAVCFGGRYYGALLSGKYGDRSLPGQIEIPLGGAKTGGIALLLSCTPPQPQAAFDPARGGKYAFSHFDVAIVRIRYADGSRHSAVLKYRRGISGWNEPFGGYEQRTAFSGKDRNGGNFRFDVFSIENPHPDKPVVSLTLESSANHGAAPVLLALSLLDMTSGKLPAPDPDAELMRINFRPPPTEK